MLSAGTRNHFARDLGLDTEDPAAGLTALTDGVEVRVDLGRIGGRPFVTDAAFGAYADLAQTQAFREDRASAALDLLPELLAAPDAPVLRLRAPDATVAASQAVLVSNNPYGAEDIAGLGRRSQLDGGILGLLAITLRSARDAVKLLRGRRSGLVTVTTATEAVVEADAPEISVGIDGEAVSMATPVRCSIRPGALRVRVPRWRPGSAASAARAG